GEPEVAVAVVEEKEIRILEIVGDVEIGGAVAVQVGEAGREGERLGRIGKRLVVGAAEPAGRQRLGDEPSMHVVKELIALAAHGEKGPAELRAYDQLVVAGQLRTY